MRTPQYQYTEWLDKETEEPLDRMLYDHYEDPDENVNIAALPEYQSLADSLSGRMRNWWAGYKRGQKDGT